MLFEVYIYIQNNINNFYLYEAFITSTNLAVAKFNKLYKFLEDKQTWTRAADLTVFPKRFTDGSKPFSNQKPLKPFNRSNRKRFNRLNQKPFETVQAVFRRQYCAVVISKLK